MNWTFDGPKQFKDFASYLTNELNKIGEEEMCQSLVDFNSTFFNSSTEFLGELRILLKKILDERNSNFPVGLIDEIKEAIKTINKAFGNNL